MFSRDWSFVTAMEVQTHEIIYMLHANPFASLCQIKAAVMTNIIQNMKSCKWTNCKTLNIFNTHWSDQSGWFVELSRGSNHCTQWISALHHLPAPPTFTFSWPRKFKTVCYFYLIFHVNCTSHTKLTDSARLPQCLFITSFLKWYFY